MAAPLRLALAQLDLVVGDLVANEAKLRDHLRRAREAGAQLVVFPELAVTGYSPEDLQRSRGWTRDDWAAATDRCIANGLLDDSGALTSAGSAESAASSPRGVGRRVARTPAGSSRNGGVLMVRNATGRNVTGRGAGQAQWRK